MKIQESQEKSTLKTKEDDKKPSSKFIQTTGRRKTSVARVRLIKGKGDININDRDISLYFSDVKNAKELIIEPLILLGQDKKYDISVKVQGGGKKSQVYAIRLGVARSILKISEDFRPSLKKGGFLTRDSRMKERKKYGLKRARKAPQFRKR